MDLYDIIFWVALGIFIAGACMYYGLKYYQRLKKIKNEKENGNTRLRYSQ